MDTDQTPLASEVFLTTGRIPKRSKYGDYRMAGLNALLFTTNWIFIQCVFYWFTQSGRTLSDPTGVVLFLFMSGIHYLVYKNT